MAQIEDLKEIRNLMEKSSRFLSLSGFSGIIAGIAALLGAVYAWWYINQLGILIMFDDSVIVLLADALIVFFIALFAGVYFSWRKAIKQGVPFWSKTSKRLLIHFLIPLITGGIFCFFLIYHQYYLMIIPATLIFYGMALVNASKFTYSDTYYFGLSEIFLGILASFFNGYGIWFWGIGFGVLHILYGIVIYFKYDYGVANK
ncbi:MAG: hypothetical protein HY951_13300 [Bacteroidia bacterium]|nr:hypothetical protein [Bacteroidia bacterium]